ncbi:Leucine-rich repeat-containing protein 43 [Merluccius polli]|uniref:Leucine-rich repeat-containing protein 43 n=1 Tax=Merluccius polli TaxID=89951 RepID=A0AA47NTP5_MERPO|nr:Leucine-rich repeat-containing protein 43 [Merluccius polli]
MKYLENDLKERNWSYRAEHREDRQALVDLITCPRSPWRQQCSWSPEAELLREAAVRTPESLHSHTNHTVFRTLRVVDRGVCVIDDGLLKFSNLETLVLSANKICDISAGHLPASLKVLELHANLLHGLTSLIQQNLPRLQHLGVGSNPLGSHDDAHHLTGNFWSLFQILHLDCLKLCQLKMLQELYLLLAIDIYRLSTALTPNLPRLVSLDLSWCEFQDQRVLAQALATLACLRTLSLEGNPLTLVPSYPGFMIDSLQPLLNLDAQQIAPDQRHGFKGLSQELRDVVILEQAVATVRIQRVRGLPEPQLDPAPSPPEFPMVEYSYRVTYDFLQQSPPEHQLLKVLQTNNRQTGRCILCTQGTNGCGCVELKSELNCHGNPFTQLNCNCFPPVLTHTTVALAWDQCMDFLHTQTLVVQDLPALKRFLIRGLWLRLEEDKSSSKAGSRSKDKKKKSVNDLVQDAPITTVLGCVHVPLQGLLKGETTGVTVRCDLGFLPTKPALRPDGPTEKVFLWDKMEKCRERDSVTKTKEDKRKEEKKSKSIGGTSAQRNMGSSKEEKPRKDSEAEVHMEDAGATQQEPITVEFSVNLEKWQSVSEANQLQLPQCGAL